VDHLLGVPLLVPYFIKKFGGNEKNNVTVVSPDLGSVTRARRFAEKFDVPLAIIDKRRPKANVSEVMNIIGDVRDKKVILVDDMIDTAGTLCQAAKALVEVGGANRIFACATHGVLSPPAIERISESVIEELVLLDTIRLEEESKIEKIIQLPVSPVFAEAIERIYEDKPVSPLFI
jgi:ribose-phosphate pyrophosphokinase